MAARRSKSRFIVIVALYEYLLLFALCVTTSWWFSFKPHKYSTQSECKYTNIFEFSTVL